MLIAALAVPTTVLAQDADDGTRLERLIEDSISDGDAFDVDLSGFRGALSSNASLDRLTISDADGVWLILEDAQLIWVRSALLSGRLEVEELSAARLQVLRTPNPQAERRDLPNAEATPFSLPDLPVSIEIGRVAIDRVELSEPILGTPAQVSIEGSAALLDGTGQATLDMRRLDGPVGVINLAASYDNSSDRLELDLLVEEEAEGLIGTLIGLPGRPSLRLAVDGAGPLGDFAADIDLSTDGQQRLAGQIVSETDQTTPERRVRVDVGGDISPLIQPDYRDFFGTDVTLRSDLTLFDDGRITLSDLDLGSAALDLRGDLALDANGQPDRFALSARIANPTDTRVRLPIPGADVTLDSMTLDARFDAAQGDQYSAVFDLRGLSAADASVAEMDIDVAGRLTEQAGTITAVTANLQAATRGLVHTDPALQQALGPTQDL